ncbi:hypothetical protein SAMN02745166_03681 [Prosthecobacter debontii]|uniref:DUF6891 domain-containing protein n=1 Tax=Prosthecobacter debontii TaxID=48467 RepID=A0A1T4YLR0_9BACT|nr:hypothetical protein [Prosthecobacter debontii]SKB02767.1 hypothetical protein SAMN02745166_03681 [Prosthecobacter debontii]
MPSASSLPDDVNDDILDAIRVRVWSGFYDEAEVQELIDEVLEDGADEVRLRAAVAPEFSRKAEAEGTWPETTDCDRLDAVFQRLAQRGVLGLHNAGYTMSDGHEDANDQLAKEPSGRYFGYCFYHGQDLERAVRGEGLMLAFDHVEGDVPEKIKVAQVIRDELESAGFVLSWDGTSNKRIHIPKFHWQRRYQKDLPHYYPPRPAPIVSPEPTSFLGRLWHKLVGWSGVFGLGFLDI